MEKKLKNLYFDKFWGAIAHDTKSGLSEAQMRAICNTLAIEAVEIHDDNFKKCRDLQQEHMMDLELCRKEYIGMVNFIEKSTKVILDNLRANSLIKEDYDALKRRTILKPRTSVVGEMVKYLNKLNELVIKYYEDVYKVDKINDKEKNKDNIQSKLF